MVGCIHSNDRRGLQTQGVLFADAGEWKVQGRGGSCLNKSSRVVKMVSEDSAGSAGRTPAASNEKPTWMDNLRAKGLPKRAQAAIEKEMGAF